MPGQLELFYFPGVAGTEELREIAWSTLGNNVLNLLVHDVFIARKVVPCAKHANRRWEAGTMLHMRKQESIGRARMMRIMNNQI